MTATVGVPVDPVYGDLPAEIPLNCPACDRKLRPVPIPDLAADVRRTCQGCRRRWRAAVYVRRIGAMVYWSEAAG